MTAPALAPAFIPAQRRRSADLLRPPAPWFEQPRLSGPTPMTYTDEGRVFGHMALWRTCHVGYLNGVHMQCLRPPRSASGYRFFQLGTTDTTAGPRCIGKITVGGGHASLQASPWGAIRHYDDATLAAAVACAYEDRWGLSLAGARTPDCDDVRWAMARRSPISGDWRLLEGGLELVAALGVNSPGFPVPYSGEGVMLAAGAMPTWAQWITAGVAQATRAALAGGLWTGLEDLW